MRTILYNKPLNHDLVLNDLGKFENYSATLCKILHHRPLTFLTLNGLRAGRTFTTSINTVVIFCPCFLCKNFKLWFISEITQVCMQAIQQRMQRGIMKSVEKKKTKNEGSWWQDIRRLTLLSGRVNESKWVIQWVRIRITYWEDTHLSILINMHLYAEYSINSIRLRQPHSLLNPSLPLTSLPP